MSLLPLVYSLFLLPSRLSFTQQSELMAYYVQNPVYKTSTPSIPTTNSYASFGSKLAVCFFLFVFFVFLSKTSPDH